MGSLNSTWMMAALFWASLAFYAMWTFSRILGSTFGECIRCCLAIIREVQIHPDAADELDWERAKVIIERRCPPASYKIEDNPNFKPIMQFITCTQDLEGASADRLGQ